VFLHRRRLYVPHALLVLERFSIFCFLSFPLLTRLLFFFLLIV
jgi:hypothetical protein